MRHNDQDTRSTCVRRTWTPRQRLHVGDLAWAGAHGDGGRIPDVTLWWGDPVVGFADVWHPPADGLPAAASLHVAADASAGRRAAAVDDLLRVAPHVVVQASTRDTALFDALTAGGFRRSDGPWSVHLWRELSDLSDLPAAAPPGGYTIRPVRPDELSQRVEVHRRCWDPARIRAMLGLPVTGAEAGSTYSLARHRAVRASPDYRADLDLVAVAGDGTFAAFALGWLDVGSGCLLFEPVGTVASHARRGLARAVCAAMLRVSRDVGATQALVGARGDDAYPAPRRLYRGLGMRETTRVVPLIAGGTTYGPSPRGEGP